MIFLGQLWKNWKNSRYSKLKNRDFERNEWKYGKLKKWIIPDEGVEGNIEDQDSGYVLGLSGNMVILEEKNASAIDNQIWLRSKANSKGFFLVKNPATGKVLTVLNKDTLTIRGM